MTGVEMSLAFARLVIAGGLMLVPASAASATSVWIFNLDSRFPLEVDAQSLSVNDSEKNATFINAVLRQKDLGLSLKCSRAILWYGEERPDQRVLPIVRCEL